MPYSFPIPADELENAERQIELEKDVLGFDAFLTRVLAIKTVVSGERTREEREIYMASKFPLVKIYVNAEMRRVICSSDPLDSHNMNPRRKSRYVREDEVEFLTRKVIQKVYGNNINNRILRQKVTGCMQAIVYVLNANDRFAP